MKKAHQTLLDELEEVVIPSAIVIYSDGIVVMYGRDIATNAPLVGDINKQVRLIAEGLKFRQN
jgi:hypothetical protein